MCLSLEIAIFSQRKDQVLLCKFLQNIFTKILMFLGFVIVAKINYKYMMKPIKAVIMRQRIC